MFRKFLNAILCFAAADDKVCPPGDIFASGSSSLLEEGKVGSATIFKNILASIGFPFADSICGKKKTVVIYTRATPYNDADYAGLPIGSICIQLTISSTAVTRADLWVKVLTGATGWYKVTTGEANPYNLLYTGEVATAGGDTVEVLTITGAISTDAISVELSSVGPNAAAIRSYLLSNGLCTVTLSADPQTNHKLRYFVYRASQS